MKGEYNFRVRLCGMLMLLISLFSFTASAEEPRIYEAEDGSRFRIYEDRAHLLYLSAEAVEGDIAYIPHTAAGKPVRVLEKDSILGCVGKTVVVPETVEEICKGAFNSSVLEAVILPDGLKRLSVPSFMDAENLRLILWDQPSGELWLNGEPCEFGAIFSNQGNCAPLLVSAPGSGGWRIAEKSRCRFYERKEGLRYLSDGRGVYEADDREAALIYMSVDAHILEFEEEYEVPDFVDGIPVTTIASGAMWEHSYVLHLGNNVTRVEPNALYNSTISAIYLGEKVASLPYPLFGRESTSEGRVYGYSDSYGDRFCLEHEIPFYPFDSVPFRDVKKSDWYYDAILYCYRAELMNGVSWKSFLPGESTDRAMVCQILYNMSGIEQWDWVYGFTDVKKSDWYASAVNWCRYYGLTKGTTATTFSPKEAVTRQELAAFLYRYAVACGLDVSKSGELSAFRDGDQIAPYAVTPMAWAVGNGILQGKTDRSLDPLGLAKRAEIAAMVQRFLSYAANAGAS